ncbi:hypothetical protein [Streptomyces sp. NPDC056049]|uniref:hypothetical protein n=1 Tax=Streptomyces sp. NPDC056049 TaxID=3345693 RepID=UPI0035DD06A0
MGSNWVGIGQATRLPTDGKAAAPAPAAQWQTVQNSGQTAAESRKRRGNHGQACTRTDRQAGDSLSDVRGDVFREREVKLNSTGMEFFNLAWANESATGLICWSCGYVQLFVNGDISLYRADA